MGNPTKFEDVQQKFHSMPRTKELFPVELEREWLDTAIADYELDLDTDLHYDSVSMMFADDIGKTTVRILALMMYTSYLQRECDRVMKLNGIYGKDVKVTGVDATKRVTAQELQNEISRVNERIHKLKTNCYY